MILPAFVILAVYSAAATIVAWRCVRAARRAMVLPPLVPLRRIPGSAADLQEVLRASLPILMREAERARAEASGIRNHDGPDVTEFYSRTCADVVNRVRVALGLPAQPTPTP